MSILKKLLTLFLISISCFVFGQRQTGSMYKNYQAVDFKRFHYGFTLGVNYMDYEMTLKQRAVGNDVLLSELSAIKPGFTVGVIGEMRLNNSFSLRFTPGFVFGSREISYTNELEKTVLKTSSSSVLLQTPILIKYFAKRRGNIRGYLIGGVAPKYDIITKKIINPSKGVFYRTNPWDFSIDLGLGFDWYLEYFKLSTELRVSIGFVDVLNHNITQKEIHYAELDGFEDLDKYTNNIDRMTSKVVSLLFHFE